MRSFPSDLTAKVNQSLQTLGNVSDPKLKIAVSRAKTTVTDANYWTVETIREKAGLGDISVAPRRFFKHYGGPDRLYEIHVDSGQVHTAIREYPDKLKQGWQPQLTLGPGSSVAITFDGEWELYRKAWRLQTHEVPWIFWVDSTGILWGQLWSDETTLVELASEVSTVEAIRGWKELNQGQNDQGIIVAFIKTDGTVWYRSYCIQPDLSYMWESSREILGFTGIAVNIGLFLTNDYRLGVTVENSLGNIWWLITNRVWVGMAVQIEQIQSGIYNSTFTVIPVNYIENSIEESITSGLYNAFFNVAEPIYPLPISAANPNNVPTEIKLKFNYPIDYDLSGAMSAFTIKDSINTIFTILSTAPGVDNTEIIFTTSTFNSASGNMFIGYDRTILELDCLNQGSRFAIESFNFEFTPTLVPPEGHILEYVVTGITSTFVLTQVYHRSGYVNENVTAGLMNNKFIVTKVGSNPL